MSSRCRTVPINSTRTPLKDLFALKRIFATVFTIVLIFAKRVITELIAKIFVLGQVAGAEQIKSSIVAVFIAAMFAPKVKENVIIEN